jgi:hypothetical protein
MPSCKEAGIKGGRSFWKATMLLPRLQFLLLPQPPLYLVVNLAPGAMHTGEVASKWCYSPTYARAHTGAHAMPPIIELHFLRGRSGRGGGGAGGGKASPDHALRMPLQLAISSTLRGDRLTGCR